MFMNKTEPLNLFGTLVLLGNQDFDSFKPLRGGWELICFSEEDRGHFLKDGINMQQTSTNINESHWRRG